MKNPSVATGTPWYRHGWPWFLVILMSISIMASLATVVVAYRHRDIDVRQIPVARDPRPTATTPAVLDRVASDLEPRS